MKKSAFFLLVMICLWSCSNNELPGGKSAKAQNSSEDESISEAEKTYKNDGVPLGSIISTHGISKDGLTLHVDKSDYQLSVMHKDTIVKSYPVVLGGNPKDDKRMQGDQCTPEGEFKIQDLYPHASWNKFIWIDYPTEASWVKHKQSKADGSIPATAKIGGEIGIHGVPVDSDYLIEEEVNWTLGCVSLKNAHVDEIYKVAHRGMRVSIDP